MMLHGWSRAIATSLELSNQHSSPQCKSAAPSNAPAMTVEDVPGFPPVSLNGRASESGTDTANPAGETHGKGAKATVRNASSAVAH